MSDIIIEQAEPEPTQPIIVNVVDTPPAQTGPDPMLDVVERLTRVEMTVNDLSSKLMETIWKVDDAQSSADAAVNIAIEAAEIAAEPEPEPEPEPAQDEAPKSQTHRWWR